MNQPFIKRAVIEWEKIGQDSYLRRIPALEGLEALEFDAPVTCFVGENGSGKSTLLEAMALLAGFRIPAGRGPGTTISPPMTLIQSCGGLSGWCGDIKSRPGDIFCGLRAFTMWPPEKRNMRIFCILQRNIMKNPMERASGCGPEVSDAWRPVFFRRAGSGPLPPRDSLRF